MTTPNWNADDRANCANWLANTLEVAGKTATYGVPVLYVQFRKRYKSGNTAHKVFVAMPGGRIADLTKPIACAASFKYTETDDGTLKMNGYGCNAAERIAEAVREVTDMKINYTHM